MTNKLIAILTVAFFLVVSIQTVVAQSANLVVHRDGPGNITLYLNGVKQNVNPMKRVRATGLRPNQSYEVEVKDGYTSLTVAQITLDASRESVYALTGSSGSYYLQWESDSAIEREPTDDRGTTSASFQTVMSKVQSIKSEVFFTAGWPTEERWVKDMRAALRSLSYYDCMTEQIDAILSIKGKVFFAEGPKAEVDWARRMIEQIIRNPTYDCDLASKIRRAASGGVIDPRSGRSKRGKIERLLQ